MVFIKWSKALSVGIPEIDEQHKILVKLVNTMHDKKSKKNMGDVLNELMSFVRVHFTTEEGYFKRWSYPFASEHIAEHEKLTAKAISFSNRFEKEGAEMIPELTLFLKDWFENHLKVHDFKYARYFKDNDLLK